MLSGIQASVSTFLSPDFLGGQDSSVRSAHEQEKVHGRQNNLAESTDGKLSSSSTVLSFESLTTVLGAKEGNTTAGADDLTDEEEAQLRELQQTDREVRAHESAHKTAGGPYAGVVSFTTVTGPDGREYAVAGEVDIDASPVPGNPEATIRKMEVVIRAALSPAEPSPQDLQVAQSAQQQKLQAQQEALKQQEEERERTSDSQDNGRAVISPFDSSTEDGAHGNGSDDGYEIVSILFGATG